MGVVEGRSAGLIGPYWFQPALSARTRHRLFQHYQDRFARPNRLTARPEAGDECPSSRNRSRSEADETERCFPGSPVSHKGPARFLITGGLFWKPWFCFILVARPSYVHSTSSVTGPRAFRQRATSIPSGARRPRWNGASRLPLSGISRGRNGPGSSPFSTPPRNPAGTSLGRPCTRRLPPKPGAESCGRRPGRRGLRST